MSKLQYLDPLKPLEQNLVLKSPKKSELFKPINVFGVVNESEESKPSSVPEAPDIKKLSIVDHKNRSPRSLRFMNLKDFKNEEAKKSRKMNPLYYKTRDMHASYNSLMNKLYPNTTSLPFTDSQEKITNTNQPILSEYISENEDPQNPLDCKVINPEIIKSKDSLVLRPDTKSLQDYLDNLELVETYTDHSLSVNPKNYDLEDSIIEIINEPTLTKKKCMVWWEGETIPYGKFRQNPDNIIFIVGEDAYGYSKKMLFEEYQETVKRKVKDSLNSPDVSRLKNSLRDVGQNIYFDLNLNWEDNETLWIPLNQILRVLEYSHPVYEIQKMKYSMHVWNLVPVKLK